MITGIILILAGMWLGSYITAGIGKWEVRKVKPKLLTELRAIRAMNWKHCRDELDSAIKYIEDFT